MYEIIVKGTFFGAQVDVTIAMNQEQNQLKIKGNVNGEVIDLTLDTK